MEMQNISKLGNKQGGPYTKKEQEERRKKTFELHFEKGMSAVKIAEKLNVNRNTVNEDIKYWYSEMSVEFGNKNTKNWMLKQVYRLETQRSRIIENFDNCKEFNEKIKVEKLIFDIDIRLANLIQQSVKNWIFPFDHST